MELVTLDITASTLRASQLASVAMIVLTVGCGGGGGGDAMPTPPPANDYTAFVNPELVTIIGYGGDAMEPFVSRDGVYLFFNSSGTNKDMFYAAFINPTTVQFQGAVAGINSPAVEGTPSADVANRFFYVTTGNYNPPTAYDTLFSGTWNGSSVTGTAPLGGLARMTPGFVDFDIEVSRDGMTIYYAEGDFSGGRAFPDTADISIAVMTGGAFVRDTLSGTLLANVNTSALEYAPAISADGRELFFTRLDPVTGQSRIYRTTRSSAGEAFATPQRLSSITGFAEGPALSPDEKSLYYHRENGGRFDIYRVTRP